MKSAGPSFLLDRSHRGLLLDLMVLGVNLLGVTLLEGVLLGVVRNAAADDPAAKAILFGCLVALLVLAPLGATLKRWHYHRRLEGSAVDVSGGAAGCLFNPIFYFCLMVVIVAAVNAFIMQRVFGNREPSGAVFLPSLFLGLGLVILHTFLVYRFFSPPRKEPSSVFMRSEASELIGDACLFANMLFFQLAWNLLSFAGLGAPSGAGEAVARLLVLCFLALLLYFPPRMFYLAEDAGKARTWLMILLANAPVIARMLLGSSPMK